MRADELPIAENEKIGDDTAEHPVDGLAVQVKNVRFSRILMA
jgi:hypothetical protein